MKNKGFTLVEVLAAVTIMLMITIIAVPTSMKFIEKGKNQQYEMLEKQILSEASKYYIKHKDNKCIELSHLINGIDDKFLDGNKIIDPRNNKELKGIVEVRINENKVKYNLISETSDICTVDGSQEPAEVPDNVEIFYTYSLVDDNTGYKVGLVDGFKTALNNNENYVVDGETLWTVGSALPNPGSTYDGLPVTDMSNMFYKCDRLKELDLSNFDTSNVINMESMFNSCNALTSLNISNFDTSNVTNMHWMFIACNALTSLDLSNFDTSNVTDMRYMFSGCELLKSLDLSNFNTENVTNMMKMFYKCEALTSLNVSSFNTSNVTDMYSMFSYCQALTSLDLSNFDTSNVTNMKWMFSDCVRLKSLDLSNFNTENVTNMVGMFNWCSSLTSLNVSSFNTSNVTDMSGMFERCRQLTELDLSNFDTSNVTDMEVMFRYCHNLTSVIARTNADKTRFESSGDFPIDCTVTVKSAA